MRQAARQGRQDASQLPDIASCLTRWHAHCLKIFSGARSAPSAAPGALAMQAKSSIVAAEPYPFEWRPAECALLIIDMQRDFLEPGGFGEMLGNDVSQLRRTVEPNRRLLAAWRSAGLLVLHTPDGPRPDLADLPPSKKVRGRRKTSIGHP